MKNIRVPGSIAPWRSRGPVGYWRTKPCLQVVTHVWWHLMGGTWLKPSWKGGWDILDIIEVSWTLRASLKERRNQWLTWRSYGKSSESCLQGKLIMVSNNGEWESGTQAISLAGQILFINIIPKEPRHPTCMASSWKESRLGVPLPLFLLLCSQDLSSKMEVTLVPHVTSYHNIHLLA